VTHADLIEAACAWLRGSMYCKPVLAGVASTQEIPDAIGWSSRSKNYGSIVVECKVSASDFYRDKAKHTKFRHPGNGLTLNGKGRVKQLLAAGYERVPAGPSMGNFRYFLMPMNMLGAREVQRHYPDHGCLFYDGKRVLRMAAAPRREAVDYESEIRLLRFALIHFEHNVLGHGCSVNLTEATKFFGRDGITLPGTGAAQ
jgi:hypothetical protein